MAGSGGIARTERTGPRVIAAGDQRRRRDRDEREAAAVERGPALRLLDHDPARGTRRRRRRSTCRHDGGGARARAPSRMVNSTASAAPIEQRLRPGVGAVVRAGSRRRPGGRARPSAARSRRRAPGSPTVTARRFRRVIAMIPNSSSGHTRYHCSSIASDHMWRSGDGEPNWVKYDAPDSTKRQFCT